MIVRNWNSTSVFACIRLLVIDELSSINREEVGWHDLALTPDVPCGGVAIGEDFELYTIRYNCIALRHAYKGCERCLIMGNVVTWENPASPLRLEERKGTTTGYLIDSSIFLIPDVHRIVIALHSIMHPDINDVATPKRTHLDP